MSDLYFPRSLKPIVSKGYSMTRRNNIWSVDLAGGGVRQGRDTYYDVFPVSVTLVTSAMGRQAFLSFLEKVDGGASSFWMAHDFGMGIEDYQVTITSTIAESTEDGINWTITFTATAEKSPFQDENNQCLVNNLPDLYGCYGDCLGSFLKIYANYETTFPRIWSDEGPAGYPPINLLASTLDSRVIYEGPQIYYINRNGNLVQSAVNQWPLTFIGGVAVGRVPPEAAAENRIKFSDDFSNGIWTGNRRVTITKVSDSGYENAFSLVVPNSENDNHQLGQTVVLDDFSSIVLSVFVKPDGYNIIRLRLTDPISLWRDVVINISTGDKISGTGEYRLTEVGNGWKRLSLYVTPREEAGLSKIIYGIWIYSNEGQPNFSGDGESGILAYGAQVEIGDQPSSLIATESNYRARPSASAKVAMNGATSIDITYSDGSTVNVPAVNDYATIPQADSAWGSKYITRIDFNVDS